MKVLQVLTHLDLGGITTYAFSLAKYLMRNNIEVAIASSGGGWEEAFTEIGVKTFRLNIRTKNEFSYRLPLAIAQLAWIKRKFNFQILHSHTRITQVLCQSFGKLTGTPHVANFHGFYPKNKLRQSRRIFKAQGNMAIAITSQVASELIDIFEADPRKIRVILSAIDLERLRAERPSLDITGQPKIGSSGRLSSVKGFEYLLRAVKVLVNKYPQIHLYILGEGREEENLLSLSRQLNIAEHFTIVKDTDLASFLKSIDVFCLPSVEEPLGLSVLEAQFFKLPCIVSKIGGLPILVEHLNTGILIPPKDPEAIARSISSLVNDSELRERLGQNAFREVIENYDLSNRVGEFIKVYEEVLK